MDTLLIIECSFITILALCITYAWYSYRPRQRSKEEPTFPEFLTYENFHRISQLIQEEECIPLGRALGLPENLIRNIKFNHRFYGTSEIVYQILFTWKRQNDSKATTKALFVALEALGREDIIKEIQSAFQLKRKTHSTQLYGRYNLNEIINDEIIELVSERIKSNESKTFCRRLKLGDFTPVWFNKRYLKHNDAEISYQSLTQWRKIFGENATNASLANILIKIHRTDIVDELFPDVNIERLSVLTNKVQDIPKLKQNEPVKLHDKVRDDHIEYISEAINSDEWKRFGLRLGMDHVKFVWFNKKYIKYGVSEICYQMLKNWKLEFRSKATYATVCNALQRLNRHDIVKIIAPELEIPPLTPNYNGKESHPTLKESRRIFDENAIVSDEEMEQISDEIKEGEWKKLGKQLGIEKPKLVWFNCSYLEFGVSEITYQMLKAWRRMSKQNATVQNIAQALTIIQREDVVQKLYPDIAVTLSPSFQPESENDQVDGDNENQIQYDYNLNDTVTEEVIRIVSQNLRREELKELGSRLGIGEIKLVWFNHNYVNFGNEEITSQMLQAWRRVSEGKLVTLLEALSDMKRHDIAQTIFPDYPTALELYNLDLKTGDMSSPKEKAQNVFMKLQKRLKDKYSRLRSPTIPYMTFLRDPLEELDMSMTCYVKNRHVEDKGFPIHHEHIFREDNQQKHRRILIEGAAGYGKTLFACKLASDWASEDENYVNSRFELAVLVDLWRFNGVQCLKKMFLENFSDDNCSDSEKLEIISNYENKILLILDGFDKLAEKRKKSLIPLLKGKIYPRMTVVITSRTGVSQIGSNGNTAQHKHEFNFWTKRLVINAITSDTRDVFLKKYLDPVDNTVSEQLNAVFNKDIGSLCCSPLYLFLLTLLAKERNISQINTMTEFFKALTNFIVGKHAINQNSSTIPHNVNVFASVPGLRPTYITTLIDFGQLALDNLHLETFETSDRDRMNQFIQANPILKDGFLRQSSNMEVFQPVHRCFIEFFAAFHLSSFLEGESPDVKRFEKMIKSLMKEGLHPNSDSLLFPFLAGLLGNKAHLLFDALSPWAPYYPVFHQEISNMLYEVEPTDKKLLKTLKNFIPSKWNVGHNPKFSRSSWHQILLNYGTNQKKDNIFEDDQSFLIEVIEWDLQYWCYFPQEIFIDTIIFYVWSSHINFSKNMLDNIKSLKCNELIWSLSDFNETIWDTFVKFIPTVETEKIVIDVNGDSNVNVVTQIMDSLYRELTNGSWQTLAINRLKIIGLSRETDRRIISMIKELLDQGKINKGLGLKMLSPDTPSPEDEKMYQEDEKELFQFLATSETLEEFNLINFIRDLIPEFDLSPMCNTERTSWKYIQIEGYVALKIDCDDSLKFLPLEVMGLGKWPKDTEMDAKLLALCHQIKGLECESGIFHTLSSRLTTNWPGYSSMEELSLSIVEDTFYPLHFQNVKPFVNLQVFIIDMLLFYQCMPPSAGDGLIMILSSLRLKILYLKSLHHWHLKFVEYISEKMLKLGRKNSFMIFPPDDNSTRREPQISANENANTSLKEFKLSFDHNHVDGSQLKDVFKKFCQLLFTKRINQLSIVSPSDSQQKAILNSFPNDQDFVVQSEVEGFGKNVGLINKQMKFHQEIEEKICVSYFGYK